MTRRPNPFSELDPSRVTDDTREIVIRWEIYKRIRSSPDTCRGRNPSVEELYECIVITKENAKGETCNVLSVLLEPENKKADFHLGAMIYYDVGQPIVDEVNQPDVLRKLLPTASKKGIETGRSGGALGRCDPNSAAVKEFIRRPGFAPRVAGARLVMIINSPSKSGILVVYFSPVS